MATKKSRNERNAESIVRDFLQKNEYPATGLESDDGLMVEEQKSTHGRIRKLLDTASKRGGTGRGCPEFIIRHKKVPDFLIVVECKADNADHESHLVPAWVAGEENKDDDAYFARAARYAADGALHYAKALSKEFNVIAIAMSGETKKEAQISTYLWVKGDKHPDLLLNRKNQQPLRTIIPWADFIRCATHNPAVNQAREADLMQFARDLHDTMREYKLTEQEKPLLVSGTLLALKNKPFHAAAMDETGPQLDSDELPGEWLEAIVKELNKAFHNKQKQDDMMFTYRALSEHPELRKTTDERPNGVLFDFIKQINDHVAPYINAHDGLDILGKFYGEFLKYTGGDKKALGIVLTPRHITDLFAGIARVNKTSTVMDLCAGTGGFLISAMARMLADTTKPSEEERIKEEGLTGVEQSPHMFALSASNMILRGDGKTHLHHGSCFDAGLVKKVRALKPNVGMLNPPYAQRDISELRFIEHMLDVLEPNGVGIAIVPMSCALRNAPEKTSILASHTLEAVMSMPDDLFYPVGVVSCIMVFKAHVPHEYSGRDTWFGYWKEDGFVKTKHMGRVDKNETWETTRAKWLDAFHNRRAVAGESVLKKVGPTDEWCAEAYMETDYSKLTQADFERTVRNYAVFKMLCDQSSASASGASRA
ncbi:class I SAM-dependent DNA methyltransferase [Rhodanobacter sp. FW102-FHT14D06]|uniref:site-specific DNA-methyltransferase (adenine-specific) n=2 Tax=unclassified Rhodanobacter TaxID=2621553 RepID=A0AB74UW57_9GAMM